MKTSKKTLPAKAVYITCGLMLAHDISAQTFTTLHTFTAGPGGSSPYDGLVLSSNVLYGTTYFEASANAAVVHGAVFAMSTNGTGFTNLHSFPPFNEGANNSDGNGPIAGLTLSGGRLYGTSVLGGNWGLVQFSPSTPTGRVLLSCMISTALMTEARCTVDWFCPVTRYMGRL